MLQISHTLAQKGFTDQGGRDTLKGWSQALRFLTPRLDICTTVTGL